MRKIFQFCFCKIFEDNKKSYQKLLILSISLPLSMSFIVDVRCWQSKNFPGFS